MRIPLLAGLWLATVVAAAPASATRVALLQVEAPGLLPAAREQFENEVRAGAKEAGLEVQDGATTRGFVEDAVHAGLACSLADEVCALKVAVAADVDAVIVGRVVATGARSAIELRLINLDGTHHGVAGTDPPRLAARRLVDDDAGPATVVPVPLVLEPQDATLLVDGKPTALTSSSSSGGLLWLLPGRHTLNVSAAGSDARDVVVDVPGDRLLPPTTIALDKSFPVLTGVGLVVAGGGAVVAATSGGLALLVDAVLGGGVPRQDLDGFRSVGVFLVVVAATGAAVGIGGAGLAVVGGLE